MKTAILFLILAIHAQAGVLRWITYPVRHPVKTSKGIYTGVKTVAYPVRHPIKTFVHGPTLPPDPWVDAKAAD